MAIVATSLGTSATAGANGLALSIATAVASGLTIVLAVSDRNNGTLGTVSDVAANIYTAVASGSMSAGVDSAGVFYCANCSALASGNSITYTSHIGAASGIALSGLSLSGLTTISPLDNAVTALANGASAAPSVTSGSPSQSGDLFIGTVHWDIGAGATFTQAANWSSPPATSGSGNAQFGGGNQINAGTGTKTFNPTINSSPWLATISGFKSATTAAVGMALMDVTFVH